MSERDPTPGTPEKDTRERPLARRFYRSVTVAPGEDRTLVIELDGKSLRTPARNVLALPTRALADAIAAEWDAQATVIDPATMPLTRLANTAIDGVASHRAEVVADIVSYAARDLLCYRGAQPADLAARQSEAWDPVLAWARDTLGAAFVLTEGVIPIEQPSRALAAIERALEALSNFELTAIHVMTTLTGSALLALAVARGALSVDAAWVAAHVDEDWQEGLWGADAEAQERKQARFAEMSAAARFLDLSRRCTPCPA